MSLSLKRKFSELTLNEVTKYKISKSEISNIEDQKRVIFKTKKIETDKNLNQNKICLLHQNYNTCVLYDCPGYNKERYNNHYNNVGGKKNTTLDYYS